jgi:ASC-1-like (ASCH) protein
MAAKKRVFFIAKRDKAIFDAIVSGAKTVETRAATTRNLLPRAGDTAVFICNKIRFEVPIVQVRHFKSLEALLKAYSVASIYPGKTKEELKALYESFSGYAEKITEFGIAAYELSTKSS